MHAEIETVDERDVAVAQGVVDQRKQPRQPECAAALERTRDGLAQSLVAKHQLRPRAGILQLDGPHADTDSGNDPVQCCDQFRMLGIGPGDVGRAEFGPVQRDGGIHRAGGIANHQGKGMPEFGKGGNDARVVAQDLLERAHVPGNPEGPARLGPSVAVTLHEPCLPAGRPGPVDDRFPQDLGILPVAEHHLVAVRALALGLLSARFGKIRTGELDRDPGRGRGRNTGVERLMRQPDPLWQGKTAVNEPADEGKCPQ